VLVNILPAQGTSLDTVYRDYLAKKGLAESDPGLVVGQTAAADILALRANDGRVPNPLPPPFTGDKAVGVAPDNLLSAAPAALRRAYGDAMAGYCQVFHAAERRPVPWAKPPPALNSQQYAAHYNEVKALDAQSEGARTPEQTELAYFLRRKKRR
jgi:hypothetical protein